MKFLGHGFQMLEHKQDRQTDTQTQYQPHLQVVLISHIGFLFIGYYTVDDVLNFRRYYTHKG